MQEIQADSHVRVLSNQPTITATVAQGPLKYQQENLQFPNSIITTNNIRLVQVQLDVHYITLFLSFQR
jgi:hypothetical protein